MTHSTGSPDVQLHFAGTLEAPGQARRALATFFTNDADPIVADVVLAASELVTNVVLHTGRGGLMQAWDRTPRGPVRLEVSNSESSGDVGPMNESREGGGRGLKIVATISDDWGVQRTADGTLVWAEFKRPLARDCARTLRRKRREMAVFHPRLG